MIIYKTLKHNIRIVEYEDSLAATVADMWNKSAESWGGGSSSRTADMVIEEQKILSAYNIYIAMDGDVAVGYCNLLSSYFDAQTLYIGLLGVRPDYQGKKVGKALVKMCVERTIELGYPRLDIHTWSGNTKAVPLYKKCGFLWENREGTTYLVNFVPMILRTSMFASFFENADWYIDANKEITADPDGVKINKFETFGYSWEKDGQSLKIGFERSGKCIRMIETNDYKIEFIAESHEPAFGLSYQAKFVVENKSGAALDLKIVSKDEKNIRFTKTADGQSETNPLGLEVEEKVVGCQEYSGRFYVDSLSEPQNTWHIHPRVVADVCINGHTVEFGLGIHTLIPIKLELQERREVARLGLTSTCYLNLTSALPEDATVEIHIPKNGLTSFAADIYTTQIDAEGKASIRSTNTVLNTGHEKVMVKYHVTFANNTIPGFEFDYPLHLVNQDLTKQFIYESEEKYHIVNGPWAIHMDKNSNDTYAVYRKDFFDLHFDEVKLGHPYISEFNTAKPQVRMYHDAEFVVLEAEFASSRFLGIHLTMVYVLSSSGVMKRNFRVNNHSTKEQDIAVLDNYWLPLGIETILTYDNKIVRNSDPYDGGDSKWGVSDLEVSKQGEHWLFEDRTRLNWGMSWCPSYPMTYRWGSGININIECGTIVPGGEVITEPTEFVFGVFEDYKQFRNYVLHRYDVEAEHVESVMQLKMNGGSTFVDGDQLLVELLNNRAVVRSGRVGVTLDGLAEPQEQVNPADEVIAVNRFTLQLQGKRTELATLRMNLDFDYYKRVYERTVFFSDAAKEMTPIVEEDRYIFDNGRIRFAVGTGYSDALYSLVSQTSDGDQQWLFSRYPKHEPYGWNNPYIGGLHSFLSNIGGSMLIKETVTAEFTQVEDQFGSSWQGIKTTMHITEHPDHKGITLHCHYVTKPGLPVLCQFFTLVNRTGHFREDEISSNVSIDGDNRLEGLTGHYVDSKGRNYDFVYGEESNVRWADHLIDIRSNTRKEHFYIYRDDENLQNEYDNKVLQVNSHVTASTEHGGSYIGKPMFLIMTEEQLDARMLQDLKYVRFR